MAWQWPQGIMVESNPPSRVGPFVREARGCVQVYVWSVSSFLLVLNVA